MFPELIEDTSVKVVEPPTQTFVAVRDDTGLGCTLMVAEAESLQPPFEVNVNHIVWMPGPAAEGEKAPFAETPGPV